MDTTLFNHELFFLSTFFFCIFILRNSLYWLYLWQVKEYRVDRILIHIRETTQGKGLLIAWVNLFKFFLIGFYFYASIYPTFSYLFPLLVCALYGFEAFCVFLELKNRKFPLPIFTPRIILTYGLVIILIFVLYVFYIVDRFLWLILIDKLVPFFVAVFIGIFSIPSDFYKDMIINRAIQKLSQHKKVLVIGITGSYGKGSTKEYMSQILSYKFNVLKTQGTFNTPIGIAKTILSGLNSKKEIFIVEMGAYKKGDITEMCLIVKPKIGVLTAVNDQHISLFGNLQNIIRTKYELVENLPKDGLALFNGNNTNSNALYRKAKKKKILYVANYDNEPVQSDIEARNIVVGKTSLSFDIIIRGDTIGKMSVNLIGKHNIENLLPGIFLAWNLGIKPIEIKVALGKIKPLKKTMQPFTSEKHAMLIDDTFNANPAAVAAALDYMRIFKGKKMFILQPMIELGKNAHSDHYEAAKKIGVICDTLIVTNKNFYSFIKKGIYDSGRKCMLFVLTPREIASLVQKLTRGDVAVFEGKEAAFSLSLLEGSEIL